MTDAWHDFLVAQVGAGATLAGLVFVAISINLTKVLEQPASVRRAVESAIEFIAPLVVGLLMLIPGQTDHCLGGELLGVGLVVWYFVSRLSIGRRKAGGATRSQYLLRVVMAQLSSAPIVISGATLLAGSGGGLYWLPLATISSMLAGAVGAWVLLVEILR